MTMSKELQVGQNQEIGFAIPPDIVLANAMTAAKALKSVISQKLKPVMMNGEQYLEFEDWELCGQFYGYAVKTGEAMPVEIDSVKGAKAHADLINLKTGEIVGGAEAYCMRDEEKWNTRPKYEWQGEGDDRKKVKVGDEIVPWFQLASMAQTRAGAKAFRNRLAWVVVLAGYRPTPAEEIADMVTDKQAEVGHFCKVHNAKFFKRGKMKAYAHPIGDTGEWCNEPKEEPEKPTEGGQSSQTPSSMPIKQQPDSPEGNPATSSPEKQATVQQDVKKSGDSPANLGEFLTWVTDHINPQTKKGYTTKWLYSQFSFREGELTTPEKLRDAFAEVKQFMGWV